MSDNNEKEKLQILIADDSKVIRKSIIKMLGEEYQVLEAADGREAWEILQQNHDIRLLFSDLGMPRMDGYELLKAVRGADDPGLAELPVIIVTGKEDTDDAKEKMLDLGATDLVGKPFHSAELKSRTRNYITLTRKVKKLEQASPVDKLTGLSTADYFQKQADAVLSLSRRQGHDITLARINIANFAALGAEFDKQVVARIIATVGKVLREDLRKEDSATYLGGECFALLLPGADPAGAEQVMGRICNRCAKMNLRIGEKVATIVFNAGIHTQGVDESLTDLSPVMAQAEAALQQAIAKGPGEVVYTAEEEEPEPVSAEPIDLSIDALIEGLAAGTLPSNEEYTQALKKFLPLLARANQQLKLGLGKAVLHLHRRLK